VSDTLEEVLGVINAAPRSAAALTLYALVSTLEHEGAGCLFKLDKLRDLSAAQRRLAYGLMEMMAQRRIGDAVWVAAKTKMDASVRQG